MRETALVAAVVLALAPGAASAQRAAKLCPRDTSVFRLLPNYPAPPGYPQPQPPDTAIHNMCNVDQPARIDPTPAPVYPRLLATAGVSGEVLLQFVVLANAHIDTASVHVIKSTHDLFTKEARRAMTSWRAKPARYRGRAVKQLVEYEVRFVARCPEGPRPPALDVWVSGSVQVCP